MRALARRICFHRVPGAPLLRRPLPPREYHRTGFTPHCTQFTEADSFLVKHFSSVAKSESEEIDDSDGYIVQPDNPDSPKMFKVLHPSPQCPDAKFVISWLDPHDSHQFLEESVIGWYLDHPALDDDGAVMLEPSKFVENPIFKEFMHARIQECLENKQENNLDFPQVGTVGGMYWYNNKSRRALTHFEHELL